MTKNYVLWEAEGKLWMKDVWVCLGCGSDASLCGMDVLGYCTNCGGGLVATLEEYEEKLKKLDLKNEKGNLK